MKKTKKMTCWFSFLMVLAMVGLSSVQLIAVDNKKSDTAPAKIININTASENELCDLPRVGPSMAKRIIEFRTKNGKFKTVQELMKVKGIGEKTFKKFEKMITA